MAHATALETDPPRTDKEIADAARHALRVCRGVPATIQVGVADGCVSLTGRVPWPFHRVAAELAVYDIPGVRSVSNRITVTPMVSRPEVRQSITDALSAAGETNARHVNLAIAGSRVTLIGYVVSQAQRDAVERAAATSPGVTGVENLIEVRPAAA